MHVISHLHMRPRADVTVPTRLHSTDFPFCECKPTRLHWQSGFSRFHLLGGSNSAMRGQMYKQDLYTVTCICGAGRYSVVILYKRSLQSRLTAINLNLYTNL